MAAHGSQDEALEKRCQVLLTAPRCKSCDELLQCLTRRLLLLKFSFEQAVLRLQFRVPALEGRVLLRGLLT